MASRMGFLARRIAAPKAFLPVRGGDGGPVELAKTVSEPVSQFIHHRCSVGYQACLLKDLQGHRQS